MFPSWLSNGFNNVVNGASDAFNNLVYGPAKPAPATETADEPAHEDIPRNQSEVSEETATPSSRVDVAESTPLPKGVSLEEELYYLRVEALQYAEKKTKDAYLKLKNSFEHNQALAQLLQLATDGSDENGQFNADTPEAKKLLKAAKSAGVKIPENKLVFTKDERDSLLRNVELIKQTLELNIRLHTNEAQESSQMRNIWFQEMKTVLDKVAGAIKKCSDNIK